VQYHAGTEPPAHRRAWLLIYVNTAGRHQVSIVDHQNRLGMIGKF